MINRKIRNGPVTYPIRLTTIVLVQQSKSGPRRLSLDLFASVTREPCIRLMHPNERPKTNHGWGSGRLCDVYRHLDQVDRTLYSLLLVYKEVKKKKKSTRLAGVIILPPIKKFFNWLVVSKTPYFWRSVLKFQVWIRILKKFKF